MDQDNEKFLNVKGTSRLLIHNVSVEDAGYYSCAVTFTHEGMLYNVSRNIELRVNSEYLLLRYLPLHPVNNTHAKNKLGFTWNSLNVFGMKGKQTYQFS